MSTNRIELLLQYLKDDPDDAFTLYALALEYIKTEDFVQAEIFFSTLVNKHPDYLAAYYHFGKLSEKMSGDQKAIELYLKGIDLAKKQNNNHTLAELKEAYNSLNGIESDDF